MKKYNYKYDTGNTTGDGIVEAKSKDDAKKQIVEFLRNDSAVDSKLKIADYNIEITDAEE